ncbi:MAG: hypothetical protein ACQXXD_06450 [Thermoplasmatota archaeon]|jgi:hypothetical protein
MKAKIGVLFLVSVIASASIGVSYSCVNGGIAVNRCCPPCNVKFTDVTTADNEFDDDVEDPKDVGNVTAWIVECGRGIVVSIVNAYPLYEAYVNFTIKNKGSKPIHIDEVFVEDYDTTALTIDVSGATACIWISPGETLNGGLTVEILQAAKQNWEYSFQVKIKVSCEPQSHPRTIGFWKHQFRVILDGKGNLHIPAEILEQYLDEITSESSVYSFTGTQTEKFEQAFTILKIPHPRTMERRLKAHLLALRLNDVAGFADGWKYNGMTSGEIIKGSEKALVNHLTGQYKYWKNMCDGFNNLG